MLMGKMIPGVRRSGAGALDFSFTAGSLPSGNSVSRSTVGTRINASGFVESVAANTARMNYSPVSLGARGLLLEAARTNLLQRSTDFSAGEWTKTNGVIGDSSSILSPDGTNFAQLFNVSAADASVLNAATVTSGATYTFSVYARRGNVDYLVLAPITTNGVQRVWFNLATGNVGTQPTGQGVYGRMEVLPNSWYRCSVTFSGASGNWSIYPAVPSNGVYNNSTAGNFTYIYGPQLELGGLPSSLIVTTTTAVQRTADSVIATVPNGTYDIMVKTHSGGEWRNNIAVSGGSYTYTPRTGNIINLQALEFKTAGLLTSAQKDTALENTAGTLVWESIFETSVAGTWSPGYNDWHEWSYIQAIDPSQGPGATYNFVTTASSLGITAKEGTRVAQFRRVSVNDSLPHSKVFKEWRSAAFSKTDEFSRSEDTLTNNGDPNGIYSSWVWYPTSESISDNEWTNLFQFKEQGRDALNVSDQPPSWWLNMSRSNAWSNATNGLPNTGDPVVHVNNWGADYNVDPVPGTAGLPAMVLPKGRWVQIRAEFYEHDRIDWWVDQQYLFTSLHSKWPVGRKMFTTDVWIFGIGRYLGQGHVWFDKTSFRRFPT